MPAKTEKLVWLGLAGMADPMRTGMDKFVAQLHRAEPCLRASMSP